MKTLFLSVLFCLSLALSAAAQAAPQKTAVQRKLDPEVRAKLLAKTGGMISAPAEGPSILFLNTQTRVHASIAQEVADQITKTVRLSAKTQNIPSAEPVKSALGALRDNDIAVVIVIADLADYPSLLLAPENRWALVNVAALDDKTVSAELLAERTRKTLWRAFAYQMGAAHSSFEACLMKTVLQPQDLDHLSAKTLSPESFGKIIPHAQKLNMKPMRISTYRKAVEEGWAPAPTNDIQKAIWKELKGQ